MSLPSQSHSRKRKQAAVTEAEGEDAPPAPKKPKHASGKKLKKDKSKAGPSSGHGASFGSKREFQTITSTLSVSIPPIYAMEPRSGVQEILDGMLMRYGFW
jgi:DNA-directed RNA polymerase I subunit RPA43